MVIDTWESLRFFDIGTLVQADRQEESSNVPGYAFRGLTMRKLVTDRQAISSKTYPGTARLDRLHEMAMAVRFKLPLWGFLFYFMQKNLHSDLHSVRCAF